MLFAFQAAFTSTRQSLPSKGQRARVLVRLHNGVCHLRIQHASIKLQSRHTSWQIIPQSNPIEANPKSTFVVMVHTNSPVSEHRWQIPAGKQRLSQLENSRGDVRLYISIIYTHHAQCTPKWLPVCVTALIAKGARAHNLKQCKVEDPDSACCNMAHSYMPWLSRTRLLWSPTEDAPSIASRSETIPRAIPRER